ncbi:metallophosphoesterase [Arenimonas oryziterrae]|uniref:Calcineurin-like phosphoesterase domain-containing protein n=1 Tax=Arenimonas oryziterrae DSM 21050 = YC6267 TaxID=1121015 RepID=A0A091AY11_9GAMM|nr:metallophosphoesterase [Arenimonas oryziterrae]KFN43514.1 hypothetical protein N789_09575 [Arenimonas oryziterrae DSM 21050 = YC6267]
MKWPGPRGRRWILAATWAVLASLALWAFAYEPSRLTTRTQALAIPRWPPACSGLRVAVASDLHVGSPYYGLEKLDRVVATIQSLKPDLVLLPGDFVVDGVLGGHFVPPETLATHLQPLAKSVPVYAVLGNHDWWLDAVRVRGALEAAGIPVLEDRSVPLAIGECRFALAGISDATEGLHDIGQALAGIAPDRAVLAMTHNPDIFPYAPARISLLVAGHTHGGQVVLPGLGRPVVPSAYGQRYAIGHVVEQGRHLFVTPGLGTSILPVRFGVPPEISLLILSAGNESVETTVPVSP